MDKKTFHIILSGWTRAVCSACVLFACCALQAAWYWPFDPDSTNKPPRLHRLLEKANDFIEKAEDESLEGNGDKAIENYRLALAELDRVERENPDRAETPEFAPLRTKRATCQSAIDSIRFAQVNDNERAVSVTDTRELQKKWNKKHGIKTPEDIEEERKARKKAADEAKQKMAGNSAFQKSFREALELVRKKDFAGAEKKLAELQKDNPDDLNLLLLMAAVQVGQDHDYPARRTLEKAVRLHPKSYLPLYNLANLALKIDDDKEAARRHYEKGRALGGPRNEALEKLLK